MLFDPTAMVMADRAVRHHVLSARPDAPTVRERPPRPGGAAMRRIVGAGLRRLAERVERPGTATRACELGRT